MLNLRDYQDDFVHDIREAWTVVRAVLGVLPTGGGKTVCFAKVIHDHNGASAAIVHRKEIVGQISQALARLEVKHRVVAPSAVVRRIRRRHLKEFGKSYVDGLALCGVVSVQTLTSRSAGGDRALQAWVEQVTLAVYDEGHHYVKKGLWARAVECMHRAKLLFVSATPERADGCGLGADSDGFAEIMVEGPTLQWLQDAGYLCRFQYKAPRTDLNMSDIPLTASGELNAKELRKRVVESHLVGDVVKQYQQFTPGRRAIVFATDVASAEEIAAEFRRVGVAAAALSGETEQGERDATLDDFESGKLAVLVNVDLFDEGFDVPAADVVILARPTESLGKYLQMVGRVLRVLYAKGFDLSTAAGRLAAIAAGPKPLAVVIDPVRNWERHGMPNWSRAWSLEGKVKGTRAKSDAIPQRVCDGCTQPYEAFYKGCPYCGHVNEPTGRSLPEQVDGDLVDLDVEGMAALFQKINAADLSDEDFALGMIRRNIPPVGRAAELKRHQAAKYRRQVLRELVAWWVGCQPPARPMSETHKRFYFRFGVDIGTAFTLNTADTDALIERIKLKFSEDIAA